MHHACLEERGRVLKLRLRLQRRCLRGRRLKRVWQAEVVPCQVGEGGRQLAPHGRRDWVHQLERLEVQRAQAAQAAALPGCGGAGAKGGRSWWAKMKGCAVQQGAWEVQAMPVA